MPEDSLISLVKSLQDGTPALLKIQTRSGEHHHLDCVYKESIAPNFFVAFPPGKLPKTIDVHKPCTLSLDDEKGSAVVINAKIEDLTSDRSVELIATKTLDPASLREYFRVSLRTRIALSYQNSSNSASSRNWSSDGQTLDLSASGALGIFDEECKRVNNVCIEIDLVHPKKTIICFGHVVRTRKTRTGRWHIAMHFDEITQESRDAIISNCLWEQRRQLRENIQTAD